jgi:hypothetical protein
MCVPEPGVKAMLGIVPTFSNPVALSFRQTHHAALVSHWCGWGCTARQLVSVRQYRAQKLERLLSIQLASWAHDFDNKMKTQEMHGARVAPFCLVAVKFLVQLADPREKANKSCSSSAALAHLRFNKGR